MNKLFTFLIALSFLYSCKQTKIDYLKENRLDLNNTNFSFPQTNFKILGFGAYHGSSKTEDVEIELVKSLTKKKAISYYLPETDFSIAHYFNEYLQTGDTILLKDLVLVYGIRSPQERSIEMYEKWKRLKKINDQLSSENKLKVIGIDIQVNYKYVSKHILELAKDSIKTRNAIKEVESMVTTNTNSYALGDLSYAYKVLKNLVADYDQHKNMYLKNVKRPEEFKHIIKNLKISFDLSNHDRDAVMYQNYLALDKLYDFKSKPQFLRIGFSHIEKSREGAKGHPHFFMHLVENKVYNKNEILSVIGYLTNSKVLWEHKYDSIGNYTGYAVEAGFGIGDYEKEYFRGIQFLKDTKISDKTLFRLNQKNSPYSAKEPDLIEVIMQDQASNGEAVKGMSTLDFLDYAILISDSKESIPLEEMKY